MRKVKLDLDTLAVDSFTLESARDESSGTVHAFYNNTRGRTCDNFSCWVGCTYQQSCYEVCATG